MTMQNGFYVYEHIRLDTMKPFYVGKGSGTRAYVKQGRNQHWNRVAEKHGYVVNMVAENLDEEMAFFVEVEKIDQLRRLGIPLTNATDGGEGTSGRISPMRGKTHKNESKQKTRDSVKSAYADGTIAAKISVKIKVKYENEKFKQKVIDATCIALANPDVRKKMSESHKGDKNWRFGKPIPEEQKIRQIATLKARPRITCNHCGKVCDEANAKRWHFNNCKHRKD